MASRQSPKPQRPDWSRRLRQPIVIPTVIMLTTLADARTLMSHLPPDHAQRPTWRYVASELAEAAAGGDTAEASIPATPCAHDRGRRMAPPII
jgi:hypothetical protein